jgi:undecaprenyl phosphate N,N'-diacetylbacillosamine 1-phosphate transferase
MAYDKIKRFFDFVLAIILFVISSPIIIFCSLLLLIELEKNPFFFQIRPGKNEKYFRIIKLKTMTDDKDIFGNLLPDKDRLKRIGKNVRKLSLDELPQLLNVIKGDMSFVGPRPLLMEYLPLYNEIQKKRHIIRPGITGWAQINGRNSISWEQKFELDVWYVENKNFFLDLKILFLTFKKVFIADSINQSDQVTMDKFKGNN